MLELKHITKDYKAGDTVVHALKGIDLAFRRAEFVSVLGPSGCGKTTLLNIIGGLDHYTSGELYIDGVSTEHYTARDWDTYRNHRIGFVFQSYNLIPHQTICENVELALSISGVGKEERRRRAREALDKVGLSGQYNKKPNQLSGGQCQRVAIARALVNDPEILLADEPTGALDTATSVQIMDLIQEIARQCLVIMVTHNPEIAEKYSTRIIKLLDGEVMSDSNPYTERDEPKADEVAQSAPEAAQPEKARDKNEKTRTGKSKLSFWAAFKLSARNLRSKFKRSFLVCLAGSIGIIGVALVLAVSSGVQGYIADMQDDMLSGNPVTVSESAFDMNAVMDMSNPDAMEALKKSYKDGVVNVEMMIDILIEQSGSLENFRIENDITQEYIDFVYDMPSAYYSAVSATYGLDLSNNLYTDFSFDGRPNTRMSLTAALSTYTAMLGHTDYGSFATYIPMLSNNFRQAPDNADFILSQYEFVSDPARSKIATEANEIMIVLDGDSALTDLLLAEYGYYTQDEFFNIVYRAVEDPKYAPEIWKDTFAYDEMLQKKFTWYPNNTVFNRTPSSAPTAQMNPFAYNPLENSAWQTGKELTVTGILKPKKGISYGSMRSGFYYTEALAKEILSINGTSQIALYTAERESKTIASGKTTIPGSGSDELYNVGVTFPLEYTFEGEEYEETGFVGDIDQTGLLGMLMGGKTGAMLYTLTLRQLGGCPLPDRIAVYPKDFDWKDDVTAYLSRWNGDEDITVGDVTLKKEDRAKITYTDNLAIIIGLVNQLIDMVTVALVAFTSLALVVSTVMVAIITYVSVIERIKEIGVIRSLGGRKRDVSNLFNAETFIIGGLAGLIGIVVTYIVSGIVNLIVGSMFGIYTIAALPPLTAVIMVLLSIGLTLISGLIPAGLAAKKDPVEALRTE